MKLQKHLKDDQWKQDAPELNFESHSKGSEYLSKQGISVLIFFTFANISKKQFWLRYFLFNPF